MMKTSTARRLAPNIAARFALAGCIALAFLSSLASCYQGMPEARIVEIADKPETPVAYTLNVDTAAGGTVEVSPLSAAYAKGEMVRIKAVSDPGWHFTGWDGTEGGAANPLVFRIEDDEWLLPSFARDDAPPETELFTLRVDASAGGGVTVEPEAETYRAGDLVCVRAIPAAGYGFCRWKGTALTTENPFVFAVDGNEWLVAEFSPDEPAPPMAEFSVRIADRPGGTVAVTPGPGPYSPNEQVMIAAIPDAGYDFAGWGGTESGNANPTVLVVTGDEWIIPSFALRAAESEPVTHSLRVDSVPNGTVTVDPPKDTYADGEFVKVTARPEAGFLFTGWTGTLGGSQNPIVLTMTGDAWLIPVFAEEKTYQVMVERNPVGGRVAVNPDRTSGFRYGEQCTLTALPDEGYRFDGWSGDFSGTQRSVFITFSRDYQLEAAFSIIPVETTYTLTVSDSPNGTVALEPAKASYYQNETVRVTASPASGYMLSGWSGSQDPGSVASFDLLMDGDKTVVPAFMRRRWTHLVYMAADNNLDSQALNDLNEMEAALTAGKAMSVLALVDRKAGNGDWSDTRLYEIAQDPGGNAAGLSSRRLDAAELGLAANAAGELNLSDPVNLERFLSFARRAYAADAYTLTVWGHGTGWRGDVAPSADGIVPMKAVAIDETSNSFMPISGLGDALAGRGLEVIGFDTCFGALMEVAYELRDCGSRLVASEGPTRETGWDYGVYLTALTGDSTRSGVTDAALSQFRSSYAAVENATVSVVNLASVGALRAAFETWAETLASLIDTAAERDAVRDSLFDAASIDAFWFPGAQSDYYADIYSLTLGVDSLVQSETLSGGDTDLFLARSRAVRTALDGAVERTWSNEYGFSRKQLGVFVIAVNADKVPLPSHGAAYVKGSGAVTADFVNDAGHWVPNIDPLYPSALNRIFYAAY